MILSNEQIYIARVNDDIIIEPYSILNVNTSSYDVTLGEWFWRARSFEPMSFQIYNPWSEAEVKRVWGAKPHHAEKAYDWTKHYQEFDWSGINYDDEIIVIQPGELILAHTREFIGGVNNITTMMKARSSFGRNFIRVCSCAGYGDVGYFNRWTMEIENVSKYCIPLVVGRRIAQIVFLQTGTTHDRDYAIDGGKYQTNTDFETVKNMWKPEDMLPKLCNDRDIQK